MSEPRGLHPATRTQRKGHGQVWARAGQGQELESQDAPFSAVGKGLCWVGAGLPMIIAGVLLFARLALPTPAIGAKAAQTRFHTAGPPLLATPNKALLRSKTAHPAPLGPSLDAAMEQVVARGWDDDLPPPGRGETALDRARAGQ